MFKRNLWIVALVAVLAMVFIGCGEEREDKSGDWAELDVTWNYIRISGRNDNWQGIDLRAGKAGATANWTTNKAHTITVYGRVYHGSPLGQEVRFGNTDTSFSSAEPPMQTSYGSAFPRANGKFRLEYTFEWDRIIVTTDNIRLSVPGSVAMYDVYEIIIVDADGVEKYRMSEDDEAASGSTKAGVQTYEHDDPLVVEGEFTKWIVAALGTTAVTVKIVDPNAGACCTDCDVNDCPDCLAGNCDDDCYDETSNPDGTCCIPEVGVELGGTDVKISIDGTDQTVTLTAIGGASIDYFKDGTGYQFTYGGGYQGSWAKFSIDFGVGGTLSQYEKVTFTMEGVDGGYTYKNVGLLASASLPASFSGDPLGGANHVSNAIQYSSGVQVITLTIDSAKALALTSQTLEFSIYEHSNTGTVFQFSNITFIKGTPCGECGEFPCECTCDFCGEEPCECELVYSVDIDVNNAQGVGVIEAASYTLIQAARPGSVVRLTLRNDAGEDKNGWGLGHFGNANLAGFNPFTAGAEETVDIPVQTIISANTNIDNGASIVSAELWLLTAP